MCRSASWLRALPAGAGGRGRGRGAGPGRQGGAVSIDRAAAAQVPCGADSRVSFLSRFECGALPNPLMALWRVPEVSANSLIHHADSVICNALLR